MMWFLATFSQREPRTSPYRGQAFDPPWEGKFGGWTLNKHGPSTWSLGHFFEFLERSLKKFQVWYTFRLKFMVNVGTVNIPVQIGHLGHVFSLEKYGKSRLVKSFTTSIPSRFLGAKSMGNFPIGLKQRKGPSGPLHGTIGHFWTHPPWIQHAIYPWKLDGWNSYRN